jgi:hypothetical protein
MIVKAVGDFDFSRTDAAELDAVTTDADIGDFADDTDHISQKTAGNAESADLTDSQAPVVTPSFIDSYKPKIVNREWILSEVDLEWISSGCYILGTGGGGSPYQHFLRLRELLRAGATLRVISPRDLKDDDVVACGGGKGSPQVSIEKPCGDECACPFLTAVRHFLTELLPGSLSRSGSCTTSSRSSPMP